MDYTVLIPLGGILCTTLSLVLTLVGIFLLLIANRICNTCDRLRDAWQQQPACYLQVASYPLERRS